MDKGIPEPKIYIASKTKHASKWIALRDSGVNIISSWIDEAGEGESTDLSDLCRRCISECLLCDALIVYREPEEYLKGAFIEMGVVLSRSLIPVIMVGEVLPYGSAFTYSHQMFGEKTIDKAVSVIRKNHRPATSLATPSKDVVDELLLSKAKELGLYVDFSGKTYDGDKEAPMDRIGLLDYLINKSSKAPSKEQGEPKQKVIAILKDYEEDARRTIGKGCNYERYLIPRDYELIADDIVKYFQPKESGRELEELRAWKESAMSVMPDMQAIGKALGVKLGQSVHDKILPGIEELKKENEKLKGLIEKFKRVLVLSEDVMATMDKPSKYGGSKYRYDLFQLRNRLLIHYKSENQL